MWRAPGTKRPIVEETGDLLNLPLTDDHGRPIAFGHGNNMLGGMLGGIAATLARENPGLREAYDDYLADTPVLGGVHAWHSPTDGRIILNLVTQVSPGPDARLGAIYPAVTAALQVCADLGIGTLALPRIGAGIGGLDWDDVLAEIGRAYHDSPTSVEVRVIQYDAPRWSGPSYADTTALPYGMKSTPTFDWGDDEPLIRWDPDAPVVDIDDDEEETLRADLRTALLSGDRRLWLDPDDADAIVADLLPVVIDFAYGEES